jgi:superfamily II DNA or RNA helicase
MEQLDLFKNLIYDEYKKLKNYNKTDFDNNDLWRIFELYSCIKLTESKNQTFYPYDRIDVDFKEKYSLTKNDTGVDFCNLIDTIGQAKCRKHVNWRDCATFFGSNQYIDENTGELTIRFKKQIITRPKDSILSNTLLEKKKFRLFEDIQFDKKNIIEYCENIYNIPPIIKETQNYEIRDYQKECIELCKQEGNQIINLPTGTGKNFIIIHALEKDKKYLILVPLIILMEQMYEEICQKRPEFKNKILLIGNNHTKNIDNNYDIYICVYNSIDKIPSDILSNFYKIFIDEAHNIRKPEIYLEVEEEIEYFDEESDEEYSEDEKDDIEEDEKDNYIEKIKKLTRFNNNVYLSATIDERDGFRFYSKSIREMIDKGYISDYNVIIPIFKNDQTDENFCKYILKFNHMIIYCENCEEGKKINDMLNKLQKNSSQYLDCKTKKSERKNIIKNFKEGSIPFLVNVRILIEGFDASITQGVVFYHLPTKDTKVIQIVGRSLRLHPLKKYAKIILPFCKDEDDKNISKFLTILSKNDYKIKDSITNKRFGGYVDVVKSEEEKDEKEDEDDEENLEEKVDEEYELRYELIYDSLGNCLIDIWEEKLNKLKEWIDANKKRPSEYCKNKIEEKIIAKWMDRQNYNYKNYKDIMYNIKYRKKWETFIQDEKYKEYLLNMNEKWILILLECKEWIDKNKKKPYEKSKNEKEKKLGCWISVQIQNYKKCEYGMSNPERRKKWEDFTQDEKYKEYLLNCEEEWNLNFQKLKEFIDKNKKKPERTKNIEEKKLADWISFQIQNYKKCEYGMSNPERRKKWEDFTQDEKYKEYLLNCEEEWNLNFQKLKEFIDKNKKKPERYTKNIDEKKLTKWMGHQNYNYKNHYKKMSNPERRKKWEDFTQDEKYKEYFPNFEYVKLQEEKEDEKQKCKQILIRGMNKGKECGANIKENNEYCSRHQK